MKRIYLISIIFLAVFAVITMSSFHSSNQETTEQTTTEGYVMVRATEIYGMLPSSLVTIYEDGTVEKTDMKKLNAREMQDNMLIIHEKLNEIKSKGYKLVSTSGGTADNIICTTYLFEKI